MSIDIDVRAMHGLYGDYAPASIFAKNDSVQELPESELPTYSAAFEADPAAKRHAACDECRKRKLRCSGEPIGCTRCVKQSSTCHYSAREKMGRPRKRRRTSETTEPMEKQTSIEQSFSPISPEFIRLNARAEIVNLCATPVAQSIRREILAPPFLTQGSLYEHESSIAAGSEETPPTESPSTPIALEDVANWPDFSTMEMLPQIVRDNHSKSTSSSQHSRSIDAVKTIQAPACPCLPNLYLTLSSLSTITSFPISTEHIETLQIAHRTALTVLHCLVCPSKLDTGIQNVMLLGTLLTILAHNWNRVRTASARELRGGFTSDLADTLMTEIQSLQWRKFAHQLLRANVFGDEVSPCPPCRQAEADHHPDDALPFGTIPQGCHRLTSINSSTSTPTLLALIEAMERRQSCWHGQIPDTGEFPKPLSETTMHEHMRGLTLSQIREVEMNGNDRLCLRIVQSAKSVLMTLNTSEPTL